MKSLGDLMCFDVRGFKVKNVKYFKFKKDNNVKKD